MKVCLESSGDAMPVGVVQVRLRREEVAKIYRQTKCANRVKIRVGSFPHVGSERIDS